MSENQEWYYNDSTGAEHGPVTADELQQLALAGTIHSLTDVWTEGLPEWVSASQVDGLIPATIAEPAQQKAVPEHQPHINLGPSSGAGSGINLGSTITPHTMGDPNTPSSPNPYAHVGKTSKSPAKMIVFGIIALVLIGGGIYFATSSNDEKSDIVPGFAEYTKANDLVSSTKDGGIHANGKEAMEIAKAFATLLEKSQEPPAAEADPSPDATSPDTPKKKKIEGIFPTYCMAKTEGGQKTVAIILLIPKLSTLADDAKKALTQGAWHSAKLALAGTPYSDSKTKLVVGIRGLTTYSKVMIGNPLMTKPAEESPLEGVTESQDGSASEEKLYPYFERKK